MSFNSKYIKCFTLDEVYAFRAYVKRHTLHCSLQMRGIVGARMRKADREFGLYFVNCTLQLWLLEIHQKNSLDGIHVHAVPHYDYLLHYSKRKKKEEKTTRENAEMLSMIVARRAHHNLYQTANCKYRPILKWM